MVKGMLASAILQMPVNDKCHMSMCVITWLGLAAAIGNYHSRPFAPSTLHCVTAERCNVLVLLLTALLAYDNFEELPQADDKYGKRVVLAFDWASTDSAPLYALVPGFEDDLDRAKNAAPRLQRLWVELDKVGGHIMVTDCDQAYMCFDSHSRRLAVVCYLQRVAVGRTCKQHAPLLSNPDMISS